MATIHPTALVDPGATLGDDVDVGPYAILGAVVTVGAGSRIGPHVVITGRTSIGARNRIFQFASVGEIPQDRGATTIGNGNWFLAYTHVAHDCIVGNFTTFSNNAQIAGHVTIGDWVVLGAYAGVHQFCRIGAHAMLAAGAIVLQDVPPYVTAAGYPAKPAGTNNEGLRRRGFSAAEIAAVRRAYKTLYRNGLSLEAARDALAAAARDTPLLTPLVEFMAGSVRGIIR